MTVSILQSNYILWKGYFDIIAKSDVFVIYDEVQYTKNDWRNRNVIKTQNGLQWLTIEVRQDSLDQKICNTQVFKTNWTKKRVNKLQTNYAKAPFFKDYKEIIFGLYEDTSINLSEINFQFIKAICNILEIDTKIIDSRTINKKGENLGSIYRKCPVDFTSRYNAVIEANKDIIEVLDSIWKHVGSQWNQVLPTPEDFKMLYNVCEHSVFVTNVCSSTIFDFVAHDKPCIYYNYEQPQLKKGIRDIGQNYKYVHFRSMPTKEAAVFCTDKKDLEGLVKQILDGKLSNLETCKTWYKVVVGKTPTCSSEKIWKTIKNILN